jgi:hypothetical protein
MKHENSCERACDRADPHIRIHPRMPRRTRPKTAILSVRLQPDEKRYLELASEREAEEIAKLIQGVPMTVSSFVRWAALQKAEQRLGFSIGDFSKGRTKKSGPAKKSARS